MKIFLSSLAPVSLIFILIPGKVMSDTYVMQTPREITLKVGQSATITCSGEEKIGIKEMHFWRNMEKLLNLTVRRSDISSTFRFSGTFGKFKWILDDEGNMFSYVCTDKTEMNALKTSETKEKTQIECPSPPDESSTFLFLYNGSEQVASLWIDPAFRSHLHISGTIQDLTLMLKNVSAFDINSYQCRGKANGIDDNDMHGQPTILNVKNHGISRHTGNLGLALAVALTSWLIKLY